MKFCDLVLCFLLLQQLQWDRHLCSSFLVFPCTSLSAPVLAFNLISTLVFQGSDPTAFSVLTQAITGQVGFVDAEFCTTCGGKGADKRCSVCKMVRIKKKELHWGAEDFECFSLHCVCRLRKNDVHACTEDVQAIYFWERCLKFIIRKEYLDFQVCTLKNEERAKILYV